MQTTITIVIGLIALYVLFRIFKAFLKWAIIILLIVLVAAYFTKPDESTDKESLKVKTKELSVKKVRQKDLTIEDYKLFSLAKITTGGEKKIVGIGAFGKVWYFDDLKEKLERK